MKLLLIQHGEAVDKEMDPDRPLAASGVECVRRVARFVKGSGVTVDGVWHSGKTRAAQTARLVAEQIAPGCRPVEETGLKPNDDATTIARVLESHERDLAIAGHMPHLSRLASVLLTGSDKQEVVAFQRGGIVALERDAAGAWRILWAVPPGLVRE
ncbi:MAG: phosphohistidine phosphatase SixA [Candidatus Hydrogenedentes bacterium]|nr:phosphohistidine phosphatase SixA [Candidatus Hydrogenedentota bacterium]